MRDGRDLVREPGNTSQTRLGLIVSRKVGNAVVRNRVKRSIREWFRTQGSGLTEHADIVVIARRGADGLTRVYLGPYDDLEKAERARDRYDGILRACE